MAYRNTHLISALFNMKEIDEKVKQARNEKKIFMILNGYEPLRQSLLTRDWIEKVPDGNLALISSINERFAVALLLKNHPFHFVWQPRSRPMKNYHQGVRPFINSIMRERSFDFTTKDGLNNCVANFKWHHVDGLTDLTYQRTFVLSEKEEKQEFADEFRRTSFTSFITFLDDAGENFESLFIDDAEESIETDCVEFAIQKIELIIKLSDHEDIDTNDLFNKAAKFPSRQSQFLEQMRQVINGTKQFRFVSSVEVETCKKHVRECAEKIRHHWPGSKYDGYKNVWIMKPIGQSSGYGVTVMNSHEKIMKTAQFASMKYMAQKYVEKPMLIWNRKFDLRIYFITVIHDGFVDIWLYKDCYAKFSSEPFSLDNLHKSVHVTNYAVQKYFMKDSKQLPEAKENMWSLSQLEEYFKSIDEPNLWKDQIYPAIKKNILAVILPSLEVTDLVPKNFELNGADFMIGFDYQPILIEVNSVPALFFSKTVVELITRKLLEDLVKVVIDREQIPQAPTGDFELIHSVSVTETKCSENLLIFGKKTEIWREKPQSQKSNKSKRNTNFSLKLGNVVSTLPTYYREKVRN